MTSIGHCTKEKVLIRHKSVCSSIYALAFQWLHYVQTCTKVGYGAQKGFLER